MNTIPSIYNHYFTDNFGRHFAFSGHTGALVEITDANIWGYLTETSASIDKPTLSALHKAGFAIERGLDEANLVLEKSSSLSRSDVLSLQIAPTLKCNFSCIGCIQGEKHVGNQMSSTVQSAIVRFAQQISKNLHVGWYGGEPLVAIGVIRDLTQRLIEEQQKCNRSYSASMTTNAYLITRGIASELVHDLHVSQFQVTLDGDKVHHDATRPLANGEGTFDRVFQGLLNLVEAGAEIKVRANVDWNNWHSVEALLDLLKNAGLTDVLITAGMKHGCENDCSLMSTPEFARVFVHFQEMLYEKGFINAAKAHLPIPLINSCMLSHPFAFAIDPKGLIYKCID